ncbi:dynamin family protein [Paenibacillus thiaminolyticus]|uniref:dynamin family protein n=1 Tax=Paenibacillus thiaminolyticus TaxID=49283 RepID=UPI00232C7D72|nr:dynamin family protein [Paenibacillus thiaminolyticus]WCF06146.1 dynamin family protein [Paenibacillus thiaminolyticus]
MLDLNAKQTAAETTAGISSMEAWLEHTADQFRETGDLARSRQMLDLLGKWRDGTIILAFCGHFSAGKSTVINRLCGAELLPSSPIPTSANVVTVRYGKRRADIMRRDGEQASVVSVPIEQLAEVCRDGEAVERVYLYNEADWLKEGAALLDTPGVDSADPAHREATEAAMHLADVVFYVTDYNHVQSEYNFAFAKEVADAGKPLIWIVNQIDKHREREIAFDVYRDDVKRALGAWQLKPAAIFYVSLKEPDHPLNEWASLERYMRRIVKDKAALVRFGVERAARELAVSHIAMRIAPIEQARQVWIEALGGTEAAQALRQRWETQQAAVRAVEAEAQSLSSDFQEALQKLLRDANITPAATRDLAQSYLEARMPGFRVGLLFSGQKTEQERERRLTAFAEAWREGIRANVGVHVLRMIREAAHAAGMDEAKAAAELEAALPALDGPWLAQAVQPGAGAPSEYTLNYCRALGDEARSLIRRAVLAQAEPYLAAQRARLEREAGVQRALAGELSAELAEDERLAAQEHAITAQCAALLASWEGVRTIEADDPQRLLPPVERPQTRRLPEQDNAAAAAAPPSLRGPLPAAAEAPAGAPVQAAGARRLLRDAAQRLTQAAQALAPLPAMRPLAQGLRDKSARLEANRFTVALFGAFSAGKSSFANALMGQDALPVSPNPTTAAINTIAAPTEEHPHGTARITMKSEAKLLDDVRFALESMGQRGTAAMDMDEVLKALDRHSPETLHPTGRPHYSFIQAVKRGYDDARPHLGAALDVGWEEYRAYVKDEWKSAFVERIDLHLDSPLTREGFVLVDTPGADSINARHTGVTFNYMKNADIILFVTYYNHAFSQADRQFLTQLGRVKDAFELDKMFFLVNAADLAASGEELEGVVSYVSDRLTEFGIRRPRLFPVSSLRGLEARLSGNAEGWQVSGLAAFEEQFLRFASEDLAGLSAEVSRQELRRVLAQLLAMWDAAHADASERARQAEHNRQAAAECEARAREWLHADERARLEQEADELLYHVRQRMLYRFNDSFAYAFNPASLRQDARGGDAALERCYREWLRLFRKELSNELYATSLRLEQTAKRIVQTQRARLLEHCEQQLPGFALAAEPLESWPTPEVQEPAGPADVSVRWLRSYFRNAKAFFEGGGRDALRQALEEKASQAIQLTVRDHRDAFAEHALQQMGQTAQRLRGQWEDALRAHAERLDEASRTDYDAEPLREAIEAVRRTLE